MLTDGIFGRLNRPDFSADDYYPFANGVSCCDVVGLDKKTMTNVQKKKTALLTILCNLLLNALLGFLFNFILGKFKKMISTFLAKRAANRLKRRADKTAKLAGVTGGDIKETKRVSEPMFKN